MTMNICKTWGRWGALGVILSTCLCLIGCGGGATPSYTGADAAGAGAMAGTNAAPAPLRTVGYEQLKPGDALVITLSDIMQQPALDAKISPQSTITLLYNQTFWVTNMTRSELEKQIHDRYVPKYFKYLTVNVRLLDQSYSVGGDVKNPNRYPFIGPITVTRAIQSAGDFTEFANKRHVELTRVDGRIEIVDCVKVRKNPKLDPVVNPGDKINVPRKGIL